MKDKLYESSFKIKSNLTRREKNRLIDKYGDELYRRRKEDKEKLLDEIMAREKREMSPIMFFIFSAMIRFFLSKLLESIL